MTILPIDTHLGRAQNSRKLRNTEHISELVHFDVKKALFQGKKIPNPSNLCHMVKTPPPQVGLYDWWRPLGSNPNPNVSVFENTRYSWFIIHK